MSTATRQGAPREALRESVVSDERVDLYGYAMDLYRRRWIILGCGVVGVAIALVYLFTMAQPIWISSSKILPSGEKPRTGQLSGLAALAGISIPQEASNEALYGEILHARDFLDTFLVMTWPSAKIPGREATLSELWKIKADSLRADGAAAQKASLLANLSGKIFFAPNPATGVMRLDVLTDDPILSHAINSRLLDRLDAYNRDVRKTKASENRRFVAKSAEEARQNLQKAEEELRRFRDTNRTVSTPTLQLELERRMQEVEINRNIYLEMRKQYELARIDEFKSVNFINVLEAPQIPVNRAGPRRKMLVGMGLFLGLFAGLMLSGLRMAWLALKGSRAAV